jgi:hypothetical protein
MTMSGRESWKMFERSQCPNVAVLVENLSLSSSSAGWLAKELSMNRMTGPTGGAAGAAGGGRESEERGREKEEEEVSSGNSAKVEMRASMRR